MLAVFRIPEASKPIRNQRARRRWPRAVPWLGGALLLASGASAAGAGTIRGLLTVPGASVSPAALTPYPGQARSLCGMDPTPLGRVTDAVVYLEQIPAAAESTLARCPRPARLAQLHQAFVPRVLPVAVGTTVEFPNEDPIYHNVFSVSPVKRFDLGKYPRGHSKSVLCNRTGVINVYCDIHSDMAAFIVVVPNHGYTQPDTTGAFVLEGLPAGRYTVHAWHPDLGERKCAIEVPAEGEAAVKLVYAP